MSERSDETDIVGSSVRLAKRPFFPQDERQGD